MDAISEVHPTVETQLAARRFLAMAHTFEDATVVGFEPPVQDLVLPPTTATFSPSPFVPASRRS